MNELYYLPIAIRLRISLKSRCYASFFIGFNESHFPDFSFYIVKVKVGRRHIGLIILVVGMEKVGKVVVGSFNFHSLLRRLSPEKAKNSLP